MESEDISRDESRLYLTTAELLNITGITRKALRGYEANGIVTPFYEDDGYYKHWTLDQANGIQFVKMLNRSGVPLKDIAEYADDELELAETCYRQAIDEVRQARRRMKRLAHRRCVLEDYAGAPGTDGFYIRWLPQRWIALVPIYPSKVAPPNAGDYMLAHSLLRPIVDVVGWPRATTFGTLASVSRSTELALRYGYIDLANPVEMNPDGSMLLDCGCYHVLDPKRNAPCDVRRCYECAHFGRIPSRGERAAWRRYEEQMAREGVDVQEHTVRVEDLERPYLSGAWSLYTKSKLGMLPDGLAGQVLGPTVRPRLMPHETLLPCGATVGVLPAGFYLCAQSGESELEQTFTSFLDTIEGLDTNPISEQEEAAAWEQAVADARSHGHDDVSGGDESLSRLERRAMPTVRSGSGFRLEPLAVPFALGDDLPTGWSRAIDAGELGAVSLRTHSALAGEDGYILVCARTPFGQKADEICHELQVYIDAPSLTSDAVPVTRWVD